MYPQETMKSLPPCPLGFQFISPLEASASWQFLVYSLEGIYAYVSRHVYVNFYCLH